MQHLSPTKETIRFVLSVLTVILFFVMVRNLNDAFNVYRYDASYSIANLPERALISFHGSLRWGAVSACLLALTVFSIVRLSPTGVRNDKDLEDIRTSPRRRFARILIVLAMLANGAMVLTYLRLWDERVGPSNYLSRWQQPERRREVAGYMVNFKLYIGKERAELERDLGKPDIVHDNPDGSETLSWRTNLGRDNAQHQPRRFFVVELRDGVVERAYLHVSDS